MRDLIGKITGLCRLLCFQKRRQSCAIKSHFLNSILHKVVYFSLCQTYFETLAFFSDYDRSDDAPTPKNPMAAAGAVKDALATGGVDKVICLALLYLF